MQTQALVNYVNEFDRITGELSKSNIPPMTKEFLEKRKHKLKELVKNSLDQTHENPYNIIIN